MSFISAEVDPSTARWHCNQGQGLYFESNNIPVRLNIFSGKNKIIVSRAETRDALPNFSCIQLSLSVMPFRFLKLRMGQLTCSVIMVQEGRKEMGQSFTNRGSTI